MKYVFFIISKITEFYFNVFFNVLIEKSLLWRVSFHKCKKNKIELQDAKVEHTKIFFSGENNTVSIKGLCHHCCIEIYGSGHIVNICARTKLHFVRIIVRGKNCNIDIGDGTTIGSAYMVCMGNSNSIVIGRDCMFAENVEIWSSDTHPIFTKDSETIINPSKPVSIGNHVWLGKYVIVLKGVTIDDDAVVGMRSLVTRNIEGNSLNVGIPTMQIRRNINWKRDFISNYE